LPATLPGGSPSLLRVDSDGVGRSGSVARPACPSVGSPWPPRSRGGSSPTASAVESTAGARAFRRRLLHLHRDRRSAPRAHDGRPRYGTRPSSPPASPPGCCSSSSSPSSRETELSNERAGEAPSWGWRQALAPPARRRMRSTAKVFVQQRLLRPQERVRSRSNRAVPSTLPHQLLPLRAECRDRPGRSRVLGPSTKDEGPAVVGAGRTPRDRDRPHRSTGRAGSPFHRRMLSCIDGRTQAIENARGSR
jgi:hypothetical protein